VAGDDFYPAAGSPSADITAPMVFAGRGRFDLDNRIDDFAGLDLAGRIVLVLERARAEGNTRDDAPPALAPRLVPDFDTVDAKAREAARRGAAGLVIVSRDPRLRGYDRVWPENPSVQQRSYRLAGDVLPIPVVRVAEGVGATLLDVQRDLVPVSSIAALAGRPDLRFTVDGELRVRVDVDSHPLTVHNVLGLVAGRDPELRQELVVLGAHLDHDGIDASGEIYNGADDDGSGTVAVLEVAEALAEAARAGWSPRRSILLAFWNAEEKGLLGSRYFTANVQPEGQRPVVTLNLDMVGRYEHVPSGSDPRFRGLEPRPREAARPMLHMLGYSFSADLARLAQEEAQATGLVLEAEYDAHPIDLLRRSDHWPFLQKGVPSLFFTTGLHPDYHTPDDDVDRIEFAKLEQVARLSFRMVWRVAEAATPPQFAAPASPEP
jgi:hypothetical protein